MWRIGHSRPPSKDPLRPRHPSGFSIEDASREANSPRDDLGREMHSSVGVVGGCPAGSRSEQHTCRVSHALGAPEFLAPRPG
jgi:hypothetical protein